MPLWQQLTSAAGVKKNRGPVGAHRCQQPHGFEARKWDIDEGEESEKDVFQGQGRERRKGVGGWETRDEEAQQLNIPQPVVNSEWGRKTMSPLILRAHCLLFRRQVQPQVGGEREREKRTNQDVSWSANQVKFEDKISSSSFSEFPPSSTLGQALVTRLQGKRRDVLLSQRKEAKGMLGAGGVWAGGEGEWLVPAAAVSSLTCAPAPCGLFPTRWRWCLATSAAATAGAATGRAFSPDKAPRSNIGSCHEDSGNSWYCKMQCTELLLIYLVWLK